MHHLRTLFNAVNYTGYCLWGFSVLHFFEQLINDNFNFHNINNFLSCLAAVIALVFAVFKLIVYIRDSRVKSELLQEDLRDRKFKTLQRDIDEKKLKEFYEKWHDEFLKFK